MVDDKRFRIFFVINPLYHSRNIANSISSQSFWYNSSDFRTTIATDATEFTDPEIAVNMVKYHANREHMLHLMLEFYNYNIEVRYRCANTWAPIEICNRVDRLLEL